MNLNYLIAIHYMNIHENHLIYAAGEMFSSHPVQLLCTAVDFEILMQHLYKFI